MTIHLNPADKSILDLLENGRCTPAYIANKTDYDNNYVLKRLKRLEEHNYVENLEDTGLYELVEDPREVSNSD